MLLSLFLFTFLAQAALQEREIHPPRVDSSTVEARGPHLAFWDDSVTPNGLLMITLAGTNSRPRDYHDYAAEAASLGYQVISVDYPNTVISTTCRDSPNPLCFDQFRREIVLGDAVSDLVQVDRANSIEFRIESLLRKLANQDFARWGRFVDGAGQIRWDKIVVTGHSQGSGHAAFLAKAHALHGAILMAGPQDVFASGQAAPWLSTAPSLTSSDRIYTFVHEKDFFGSDKQIQAARTLTHRGEEPAVNEQALWDCPGLSPHIVTTDRALGDAHMSVINVGFVDIWRYMLRQQIGR